MTTRDRRRIRHLRIRWGAEVIVAVTLVILAIVALGMIRAGALDVQPWAYIAVTVAILAAVGAMMLTIGEAYFEDHAPEDTDDDAD